MSIYEGCLLYFGILQPFCYNLPTDNSIVQLDIFEVIRTQSILPYERYLCFCSNLKDLFRPKNGIKSWTFSCDYFYNFRRGLTQQQCIDELNSIFGDEAPSRTNVYRWYDEFSRGRSLLQDGFRKGRPKSVVIPETIGAMRQLILIFMWAIERLPKVVGISGTSIHSILHEHLTVNKNLFALDPTQFAKRSKKGPCRLFERNAPKIRSRYFETRLWHHVMNHGFTPENKQQSTVWVFRDDPNLTKVAGTRSTSKQMIAWFFGKTGHVAANSEWFGCQLSNNKTIFDD